MTMDGTGRAAHSGRPAGRSSGDEARKYVVGPVSDFPPGSQRVVTVGRRVVAVFNFEGTLYALYNQCPHQGGSLCAGTVVGRLESAEPGRYDYDSGRPMIKCPWHGWEFELATGQSWTDPARVRVRPYAVEVASGGSLAEDPDQITGPYRATTVPIAVDGDYVVVSLS
jgi:nitrite reductase/ring-hydroxylating ferredoxin subunit